MKPSYYRQAVRNLEACAAGASEDDLFGDTTPENEIEAEAEG